MSLYTHAVVDQAGRVLRLIADAEEGSVQLPSALPHWPAVPTSGAELRLINGELCWHDPRTLEQRGADARAKRDTLLAATDWRVTRALEQGVPVPADWATYRQALRDLPQQPGFPDDITWPAPPA